MSTSESQYLTLPSHSSTALIVFGCGCERETPIGQYNGFAARHWALGRLCHECWALDIAARAKLARARAHAQQLPRLLGTKKQKDWAEVLREMALAEMQLAYADSSQLLDPEAHSILETMMWLYRQVNAGFWITRRDEIEEGGFCESAMAEWASP